MRTFTRSLWDDRPDVTLTGYLLHNSSEYQTDKRRPAVVICPGGGYLMTSDREAEPVAIRFASMGYQAFVLRYSTYAKGDTLGSLHMTEPHGSHYPQPLYDLAKALQTVRAHADEWLIDPERIVVAGFSAGGHLAASLGVHWHEPFLQEKLETEDISWKPDALVLGYAITDYVYRREQFSKTAHRWPEGFFDVSNLAVFGVPRPTEIQLEERSPVRYVSEKTPPSFLWHTADDHIVFAANSLRFAAALAQHKVPYELHVFESGVHGLSMCDETTAVDDTQLNAEVAVWFDMAAKWLKKRFNL